jgi:acyl-CoA synthetase (AMP-forming)/AMP-acid ligase II
MTLSGEHMPELIHELIAATARRTPAALALRHAGRDTSYAALAAQVEAVARGLLGLGLAAQARVAVWLDRREEAVLAMFGAAAAGCVFVPIDPALGPVQVAAILRESGARVLVSTAERLAALSAAPVAGLALCAAVCVDGAAVGPPGVPVLPWAALTDGQAGGPGHCCADTDLAALFYSADDGVAPQGVGLSHRNMVAGARSVARYLDNHAGDRILALLPFSSDYGLSQLTTAFASGAAVILINGQGPREVRATVEREAISGLAGVPSMWRQLAALDWQGLPGLRYLTSAGGCMTRPTIDALRYALPRTRIYLMHGRSEACRPTCLAPRG